MYWRLRNVGLGPCIIDRIEIHRGGEIVGSYDPADEQTAERVWNDAVQAVLREQGQQNVRVEMFPMTDFKRALAVSEYQATVRVGIGVHANGMAAVQALEIALRPVVYYRSLSNISYSTRDQYENL